MTRGSIFDYYGIIHVLYKDSLFESHDHYREVMDNVLEEGMYHASERHFHRVIIYLDGVRSGGLPWNIAEEAVPRAAFAYIGTTLSWTNVRELVIVTYEKQDKERWEALLRPLMRNEGPNSWKEGKERPPQGPMVTFSPAQETQPSSTSELTWVISHTVLLEDEAEVTSQPA